MELKQVQYAQSNHAERLSRLEKRQADDAALKSVWNSPFPGVLSGTPQHGPVAQSEVFDDLDDSGDQLLGSLHLGPAEEEPTRRGAASRANSVRFDESALHGSSWGGHHSRHSGDFGPTRPSSGLMMERTLSHKSDGRHSSAGHSVHSHHSVASGRASSVGLDTTFAGVEDDDSSVDIPGPPASFFVLGTVPSIVRCWLTTNYAHATLLYADICTGAQKSTVEYSLIRELDIEDEMQRDSDGAYRIRLHVYFAEAVVIQHSSRSTSPERSVPSMTVSFEVVGVDGSSSTDTQMMRIFVGSDALRAHSADILFSKNTMVLYGDDRSRIRVPFVRPENDTVFKHITTSSVVPGKPKLNANATPFVFAEPTQGNAHGPREQGARVDDREKDPVSPTEQKYREGQNVTGRASGSENGGSSDKSAKFWDSRERPSKRDSSVTSEASRRESGTGIWGSWRHGANGGSESARDSGPLSGYLPAARSGRPMKILKPPRPSSSARTGASHEPTSSSGKAGEGRAKGQAGTGADPGTHSNTRWNAKRTTSHGSDSKPANQDLSQASQPASSRDERAEKNGPALPRSANPVGGASAFSWMAPPGKPKTPTTAP
ncbi:uncharacterized protein J7T54_003248 [Emericellopsis cladophorae]|uniref:Ubiquitin carboxyl-terminal hydrolase 19 n=1 Tax=Emericellopsis cladophorae TaxID=2686198 RepID=A0A9P9Y0I7_9HYPO|nr:uncharacterized protein J7T54_003248 [Emericellopsis cladophorae]KAI6781081.1 hypothetical protein J7T54_003248 [Emericellopsis cladophorae]